MSDTNYDASPSSVDDTTSAYEDLSSGAANEGAAKRKHSKASKKKSKKTKFKLILALIVIVLLAAGAGYVALLLSKPYLKPLSSITNTITSKETDVDKVISAALPKDLVSSYSKINTILSENENYTSMLEAASDELSNLYSSLDTQYGEGWKVIYDVNSTEKYDEDRLTKVSDTCNNLYNKYLGDFIDSLENYDKYDYEDLADLLGVSDDSVKDLCKVLKSTGKKFENAEIKEGYTLNGRFVIKDAAGETVNKTEKLEVNIIKMNGSWTIDYLSLADDFDFDINSLTNLIKQNIVE